MKQLLEKYKLEMEQELASILSYWIKYTVDMNNGGFVGKIDHSNEIYPEAPKGSVLNSRILWTFSAAYNLTRNSEYLAIAQRAFHYLTQNFIDKDFGGVYWTVDHRGLPLDTKKQFYALSFAVYGLSEYFEASREEQAKTTAYKLYDDINRYSYDEKFGGYIEALTRDWKEIDDLRLSAKDANERKSMNTHLHILEAYANLYRVSPSPKLQKKLVELIQIFLDHIISKDSGHMHLFFNDEWKLRSHTVSYGHDVEAAWLIQEAAEILGDKSLVETVKRDSLRLANAAMKGLDKDGGLWYEYEPQTDHLIKQKHSWPQAEAMVGFFNAWQITGDIKYLEQSMKSWEFVKNHIHDKRCGEWYWGVHEDYSVMDNEDKVGIWKCPYHNSRACMEVLKRAGA